MKQVIFAAVLAVAGTSAANAANIVSENFESGFGVFTAEGNAVRANGATYAACCGTDPNNTNFFVAFGGGDQASGRIFTTFNTVAGTSYDVSFDLGALGGGVETFISNAAGATISNSVFANNDLSSTFGQVGFSFLANGSTATLSFTSSGGNGIDSILDNVSVTGAVAAAVPEPASWAMMVGGFGLIGGALRRRQRVAVRFA